MSLGGKRCQYGIFGYTCVAWAVTKRPRPNGQATWDVCQQHADTLDRLRQNIERHRPLLDRLANSEVG